MLLDSLGPCAKNYFVSASSNKSDLSFVSPRSNGARRNGAVTAQKKSAAHSEVQRLLMSKKKPLSSFLALYITYLDPITRSSTEDVYLDSITRGSTEDVYLDPITRGSTEDVYLDPITSGSTKDVDFDLITKDVDLDFTTRGFTKDVDLNPTTRGSTEDVDLNPTTRVSTEDVDLDPITRGSTEDAYLDLITSGSTEDAYLDPITSGSTDDVDLDLTTSGSTENVDFDLITKDVDLNLTTRGSTKDVDLDLITRGSSKDVDLDLTTRGSTEDVYPWASDERTRKGIIRAFNNRNRTWLRKRGYRFLDLAAWRWILSARLSEVAVSRLNVLANSQNHGFKAGPVPVFLILFLLRRRHMNDRALRMILTLIWDRLLKQDASENNLRSNDRARVSSNEVSTTLREHLIFRPGSIMVMVVRLLRRAREVWPAALPSIAAIATRYLGLAKKTNDSLPDKSADLDRRTWAFRLNSILSLLALPSSKQPFHSIIFHERAQFMIIRRMTEFEPALMINRAGYRAVAQVQIAHRKTLSEREWAGLKAKSWPPWRELKSGIDSDIGIERGISRAAEAIMRSQEAGYAEHGWDAMAKVFAGRDTDDSPTIQTRAIAPKGDPLWSLPCPSDASGAVEDNAKLWYARIKATRTVSEAWACFLCYRDTQIRLKNRYAQWPYFSMFEKIIFDRKRKILGEAESADTISEFLDNNENHPLPGDGTETWPDPGPQEAVYIRTRVPNSESFFNAMIKDGVAPGGRFLELLLHYAPTLQRAVMYLRASCLPSATRKSFFEGVTPAEMCKVDIRIFTAYIHCLCRLSFTSPNFECDSHRLMCISHAFRLMEKREPCYWPPWNFLLMALRKEGAIVDTHLYARNPLVQDALAWSVMLCWRKRMRNVGLDMQFECFLSLCIGLEKSTIASRTLLRLLNRGAFADDVGLGQHTPAGQKLSRLLKRGTSGGVEKSTLASWELIQGLPRAAFRCLVGSPGKLARSRPRNLALLRHNAEQVVANGPEILKACFEELVGVENPLDRVISPAFEKDVGREDIYSITLVPRLLGVPHPVHLHAFVRVLGLHHDYDGILKVVQWMDRFADELRRERLETTNGERAMRRLMAAIRVFLEGSWPLDDDPANDDSEPAIEETKSAPAHTIQQVFDIIKRHELWGDWPSDEDVEFYITSGKRKIDYSDACHYFDLSCRDQLQDRPISFKKRYI